MTAFLIGAYFGAGLCAVATVCLLIVSTAAMVWDKVMARRRIGRVIHEAMGGLGEEDIAALLRGDETAGEWEDS